MTVLQFWTCASPPATCHLPPAPSTLFVTVAPTRLPPKLPSLFLLLPRLSVSCVPHRIIRCGPPRPSFTISALRSTLIDLAARLLQTCLEAKKNREMSREADWYPHNTAQLQATDHRLPSSTTATPKSPRVMRDFVGRDGSSSHMAPPPVPLMLLPGHLQMLSPTASGIHQQQQQPPQPGYPTVPVGSMDGRYPKHWRVDDGQSPSGLSIVQQRQNIAVYPTQQYQSPAQAHWDESSTQPTNASIFELSQPLYGYPSISAGPSYSQHGRPTQVSTRDSPMYAAPIPIAPSQWTGGNDTQGQEPYSYHSGPVDYPQLMQIQPCEQLPCISPTLATLAGTSSLNEPSSHVPPYLSRPKLAASNQTPNSGAASGGSNADRPTSLNQQIGSTRSNGDKRRPVPKPYQRLTPAPRKTRPVTHEGNPIRLQQRCRRQGADEGAIELLGKVFTNEVTLEALTRRLTDAEVETNEFGVETGRVYIAFLKAISDEECVEAFYVCRLCHSEQIWRHHRDALRHLRRNHFGLADVCDQWYVSGHSLTLLSINMLSR